MNVILRGQGLRMAPRQIARQVRPLIGLNERQAQANIKYRERVYNKLVGNGMSEERAAARAEKAALTYAGKQHRFRAETIVFTENAYAYNRGAHMGVSQSIADGYMGRCEMVRTTAGTNRVCGRCLELKDKVVGYTDESGVTLPPLHPRCRCAIMYREVGEKKPAKPIKPHSERAIVNDNGNRNGYTINFALMNTKAYHDRFENLTKHKAVNEVLYKQAAKILGRRSGTEYEELIIIDARTGVLLAHNTDAVGKRAFQCGLSQAQADILAESKKIFEALHNHPNNSYPSTDDIIVLFARRLQAGSTIVCHDGTIYRLEKLKAFDTIKDLTGFVRRAIAEKFSGYPAHLLETRAAQTLIGKLQSLGVLKFKEVK